MKVTLAKVATEEILHPNGYRRLKESESRRGTHPPGNYAFFPLLPGLLRSAKTLVGDSYLAATLIISILLSTLGVALSGVLARGFQVSPYLVVGLLVAFPTAIFQVVLYTEGIFLFLSVGAVFFALKRRQVAATAFAFLAGLARPQGVLLALPLFCEFLLPVCRRLERPPVRVLLARLAVVLAPLSGFAVLAGVSMWVAGSPGEFLSIQSRWGRSWDLLNVFASIGTAWGYSGPKADILGLVFGLGMLPVIWRRLPLSLALYGTGMLLLPLSTGSLMSLGRFMSVSIPHFLALGMLLDRRPLALRAGVLGGFAVAQLFLASGLIAWYLVG